MSTLSTNCLTYSDVRSSYGFCRCCDAHVLDAYTAFVDLTHAFPSRRLRIIMPIDTIF